LLQAFKEWVYFSDEKSEAHKNLIHNGCFKLAIEGMNKSSIAEDAQSCLRHMMKSVKSPDEWPELFEHIFANLGTYIEKYANIAFFTE
jgi:hypothetical protein